MARIFIDKQAYEVNDGQNLLQACLSLNLNLPYFCWHPSLGSVGACRQCAMTQYQDEDDTRGRLIVACMTPVSDGMHVSMNQPAETEFRDQVISALMTHHPHDCPVCAEGGECHLQDMTVMTGHHNRQYQGKKTTFQNQDLGPLIKHEMNRCITCYRCVRFYQDYAGGKDLAAQASKNHVYFGRQCDGTLESEFSGNLVEVCPTGVFTDKPFGDHYSRKWDMQASPSICQHCSVGCNISLSERYGSVRRVTNRLNDHLNGYFLCDRGRYGFGFVNSALRCNEIRLKGVQVSWSDTKLQEVLNDSARWIGVGSAHASLEDNFALQQLVGAENFCLTLDPAQEDMLGVQRDIVRKYTIPSVAEMERADAVIMICEDVNRSAPRIALAVRQALTNNARQKARSVRVPDWQEAAVRQLLPHNPVPLIVIGYGENALTELATEVITCDENQAANITRYLAAIIGKDDDSDTPETNQIDITPSTARRLQKIGEIIESAQHPLIISGGSSGSSLPVRAAETLMSQLSLRLPSQQAMFCSIASEANSMGLALLAEKGYLPAKQLPALMANEDCDLLVLDHSGSRFTRQLETMRQRARYLIRLSQLNHQKSDDINLPLAAFSECSGSMVNYQGILQSYLPATKASAQCLPGWQWLVHIARSHSLPFGHIGNLDELREKISEQHPLLRQMWGDPKTQPHHQLAMQPPRYSGRTAMLANQTVHEPKPFGEQNAPYKQSMEGVTSGCDKDASMPYSWSPGWNSNQSNHKFKDEFRGDTLSLQTGVSVFEPSPSVGLQAPYVPPIESGKTRILPLQQVFGSESLSLFSLPIQKVVVQAQVYISPEQAEKWKLASGQLACCDQDTTLLEVTISERVPSHAILVYVPADHSFDRLSCDALLAATAEQVKLFTELKRLRHQHIQEHTDTQRERLLSQDQTIPIHFIEGAQ